MGAGIRTQDLRVAEAAFLLAVPLHQAFPGSLLKIDLLALPYLLSPVGSLMLPKLLWQPHLGLLGSSGFHQLRLSSGSPPLRCGWSLDPKTWS